MSNAELHFWHRMSKIRFGLLRLITMEDLRLAVWGEQNQYSQAVVDIRHSLNNLQADKKQADIYAENLEALRGLVKKKNAV